MGGAEMGYALSGQFNKKQTVNLTSLNLHFGYGT